MIRPAQSKDAAPIAGLLGHLGYPDRELRVQARLRRTIKSKHEKVLVWSQHGEVLGFLSLLKFPVFHSDGNYARVTAMAVMPGFQRKGIGRKLMSAALRQVKMWRCERLEVTSGLRRRGTHRFYQRMGLEFTAKRFAIDF